jgi:hypothetical protein
MYDRKAQRENTIRTIRITEVNPSNNFITGQDEYGAALYVSYQTHDGVVSVPQTNELWTVERRGHNWVLDRRVELKTDEIIPTTELNPGDKRVSSPNTLHLTGTQANVVATDHFGLASDRASLDSDSALGLRSKDVQIGDPNRIARIEPSPLKGAGGGGDDEEETVTQVLINTQRFVVTSDDTFVVGQTSFNGTASFDVDTFSVGADSFAINVDIADLSSDGDFAVSGDAVSVSGETSATLISPGQTIVSGENVDISGASGITLSGESTMIDSDVTITGPTNLQNSLAVGSTLAVTGATTLSNTLHLVGAATLDSTLDVTGTATFHGTTSFDTITVTHSTSKEAILLSGTGTNTGITVGGTGAATNIYLSAAGSLKTDGKWIVGSTAIDATNLQIIGSTPGAGITIGGDTNIYRSGTSTLKTDGKLTIGSTATDATNLQIPSTATGAGLTIGGDTNLYRSTANTLKTDDKFVVGAVSSNKDQIVINDPQTGAGITIGDTNLYRSGTDTLKTDDSFTQGINSSTASTFTINANSIVVPNRFPIDQLKKNVSTDRQYVAATSAGDPLYKYGSHQVSNTGSSLSRIVSTVDFRGGLKATVSSGGGIGGDDLVTVQRQAIGSFYAYRNDVAGPGTPQTIPNNSVTKVDYDEEDWDVSGWHDKVTVKGRFTPQLEGIYRLNAMVRYNTAYTHSGGEKTFALFIFKNNIQWSILDYVTLDHHDANMTVSGSGLIKANGTGDFFDIRVYQNISIGMDVLLGRDMTYFSGEYLGTST